LDPVGLRFVAFPEAARRDARPLTLRGAVRRAEAGRLADFPFVLEDFFFAFITANTRGRHPQLAMVAHARLKAQNQGCNGKLPGG
jgi:hypothetical protein